MIKKKDWPYPDMVLTAYGWWEAEDRGLFSEHDLVRDEIDSHDAVVILNRARIDELFVPLLFLVENHCKRK
jgi:hypothetical protein